jgi:RNA polymerase sigma factor for flagellar operon FliA
VRQRLRRARGEAVKEAAGRIDPQPVAGERPRDPESLFRYLADVGIGLAICHLLEGTGMVDAADGAEPAAPDRPYQPVELAQLRRRLLGLVDGLGGQQRTVIRYHYLQEHSFEEVATLMGVTRGRVSQIHRQALAALREELGKGPACDVSW